MAYQQMNSYDGSIYGRGPLNDPYPPSGFGGRAGFWNDGGMEYPPSGNPPAFAAPSEPEPDYVFTPTELDLEGRPIVTSREKDTRPESAIEILPQSPPRGKKRGSSAKESSSTDSDAEASSSGTKTVKLVNPYVLFLLFALVYLALNFWVRAGNMLISDYFHDGGEISTQWLVIYALIFTGLVFAISSAVKIPLLSVEMLTPST